MLSRRNFLHAGGSLALGSLFSGFRSEMHMKPIPASKTGIQLFTIPKLLEKDFRGTLKQLSDHGFRELELFGPYPFSDEEAKKQWQSVTPALGFQGSGYFGHSITEVQQMLSEFELRAPSMHTDIVTLTKHMGKIAEAARILGHLYVVIPSAPIRDTLDAYKKDADTFNAIGASAKKYGLRFAYHNHGNGLRELQGRIPFDLILEATDPELVFFEMDVYWMTAGRADPGKYLKNYPGRFKLMHVKDMRERVHFPGDGGDPQQWISLFPYMTNPGSGVLDLKTIINDALQSGVDHFLVEYDMTANPEETMRESIRFLKNS